MYSCRILPILMLCISHCIDIEFFLYKYSVLIDFPRIDFVLGINIPS